MNNPYEADDLVQDTLERALRKRHQWKRHGSIRAWLYKILYSIFINQRQAHGWRRKEIPVENAALIVPQNPAQETRLLYLDIGNAMARLPAQQRAAIALTVVEGLSYDEAANILSIPIGTLRSRIARGRGSLLNMQNEEEQDQSTARPPAPPSEQPPPAKRPFLKRVK